MQSYPEALLPQDQDVPDAAAPDIALLVGPDFSLRCVHPGKATGGLLALLVGAGLAPFLHKQ